MVDYPAINPNAIFQSLVVLYPYLGDLVLLEVMYRVIQFGLRRLAGLNYAHILCLVLAMSYVPPLPSPPSPLSLPSSPSLQ